MQSFKVWTNIEQKLMAKFTALQTSNDDFLLDITLLKETNQLRAKEIKLVLNRVMELESEMESSKQEREARRCPVGL